MQFKQHSPGILKMGTSSKNWKNFCASNVILEINNFKSGLNHITCFTKPNKISV